MPTPRTEWSIKHSTKKPTFEEKCRMEDCKFLGCMNCWAIGREWVHGEYHHCLSGNKRRGHMFGYSCCPWHHRGVQEEGESKTQMIDLYGPSLAHGSKPYTAHWGTQDELIEMQNVMLEAYRDSDNYNGSWRKK